MASVCTHQCGCCGTVYEVLLKELKRGAKFCSRSCSAIFNGRARKGVALPKRPVDQRGEKNPNWKGGVSRDNMRYKRRFQAKNPHKVRAHLAVRRAVLKGALIKPAACEVCGSTARIQGHHDDYTKPLKVRWLCQLCHIRLHAKLRSVGKDPDKPGVVEPDYNADPEFQPAWRLR